MRFPKFIILALLALPANAQTTQPIPTRPVASFFQPAVNIKAMADLGVTVAFGPSVENDKALAPDVLLAKQKDWIAANAALGVAVVIKEPWKFLPLPANVCGFCLTVDEPNAKQIPAATLKPEFDRLRAIDPTMPIFLSLAGQNITSANFSKNADGTYQRPAEVQTYLDYMAICTHVTIDVYPRNINASRYPLTWPADAVAKHKLVAANRPAWSWLECNDQQLPPPTSKQDGVHVDVNRTPTPAEIQAEYDAAEKAGQDGVGWFMTCASGKYGWPGSFFPQADRAGASMAPQYATVKAIGQSRASDPVAVLNAKVADLTARQAATQSQLDAVSAWIRAAPTTQPGTAVKP